MCHPPVGLNIYIVNSIAPDVPVTRVMWGTIPYVLCMFLAIVIATVVGSVGGQLACIFLAYRRLPKNWGGETTSVVSQLIDSPRGPFRLSKAHNPVQDIYLRQVSGKENKSIGIASKALAAPGRGCNMP